MDAGRGTGAEMYAGADGDAVPEEIPGALRQKVSTIFSFPEKQKMKGKKLAEQGIRQPLLRCGSFSETLPVFGR